MNELSLLLPAHPLSSSPVRSNPVTLVVWTCSQTMCHFPAWVPPCLQLMSLRLYHVAVRSARYYYLLQGPGPRAGPGIRLLMHQSDDTSQAYRPIPNTRLLFSLFQLPL